MRASLGLRRELEEVGVVRLVAHAARPRVERVVHDHAVREHLVVVAEVVRQAQRDGHQPGRLRCQLGLAGVGPADDGCDRMDGVVGEAKVGDESVEAA